MIAGSNSKVNMLRFFFLWFMLIAVGSIPFALASANKFNLMPKKASNEKWDGVFVFFRPYMTYEIYVRDTNTM